MACTPRIRFTKHALEKFEFAKNYGFEISIEVILNPERLDQKGDQYLAIKPINTKYALRVVYPVRRERYDV